MSEIINPERQLWVVEYGGSPRSGKGTINSALAKLYPATRTDETGMDYRAVAWGVIEDKLVDPTMPADQIQGIVNGCNPDQLTDYAATRYEIISENGEATLYTPEINNVVPILGELGIVRAAVKGGFIRRVTQCVADKEVGVLFVDGRKLTPLIEQVKGAKILKKTFVVCSNDVAASRETARHKSVLAKQGINLTEDEEESYRVQALASISSRRDRDEQRTIDPAVPEPNPIHYWHNSRTNQETVETYARRYGVSIGDARKLILGENLSNYHRYNKVGTGALAYRQSRQIVFDTNTVDQLEMILRAHQMLEEAFDEATK